MTGTLGGSSSKVMRTMPGFALMFIGLNFLCGQSTGRYFLSSLDPWMAPYYPFSLPPYQFYMGRLGVNPSFHDREMYRHKYNEPRNRHLPLYQSANENVNVTNAGQFQSQVAQDSAVDMGHENPSGRFYLGSGVTIGAGATANYLIKTSYTFVTSTGTLCFVTSCIPAALFAVDKSNLLCVRKRRNAELLAGFPVSPSNVQELEPTPRLTLGEIKFDGAPSPSAGNSITLRSSLMEERLDSDDSVLPQYIRNKRFLFVLTTTVTTYSFASSYYTSTLLPAAAAALTCRPADIILC